MKKGKSHKELVKKALSRPGVRQAYDELEAEFSLLKEMVKARYEAGKTQEEVAKKMETSTSVVGRLESSGGSQKHSPSINTLKRYANAVGCDLSIKLVRRSSKTTKKK